MSVAVPKNIARYQVLNHLESGGMGTVFLARDPAIDRLVAIKLLREGFDNAELRERFMREARSAGRLRHINIVTIFDVGEHENQPFIAMEYVEGETLHGLIRRQAALSIGRKLQLMDELCAGLQYAHRGGIIHRDIKPKNIMLDGDGVLKVLDFGIARISDAGAGGIKTQAGMLMGTLNYMAPEQMMGLPDVDARADMFSAGAVFYELLACKQAFPGGLESGILHKIINASPEPLQTLDPALDPAIVAVVNRCLEKARENRYADMAAVRRDLVALRRRYTVDEEESGSQPTMLNKPAPTDLGTAGGMPRAPVRRDTKDLDRLRASQIRSHLDDARKALTGGDFTVALEASQRALLLNGDDREALEFEQRARNGLEERQIHEWLTDARGELDRGALTSASLLVDRALSLNSSSPEAVAVRALVDEARRQLAEAQARARALEAALTGAREDLSAGALDAASARVDEALAIDAQNAEAKAIQGEIAAAVEARRRTEEEASARTAVSAARERFATGDHAGAITALERFAPAALVSDALDELRVEFREMERLRIEVERQADERRKAAEAAERLRKATARKLDDAAGLFGAHDLDGARVLTREVLAQQPQHSDARALEAEIERAIERRREVTAGLAAARAHVDAGRFEEARRAIVLVEKLDASAPDLVNLRRAADAGIRAAEAAARRQRDVEERLADANRAFELRDLTKALDQVASALKIDPANANAKALEANVHGAIQKQRDEAKKQRDAEQKQRDEEKKRRDEEKKQRDAEQRAKEQTADATIQMKSQPDATIRLKATPPPDATIVLPKEAPGREETIVLPKPAPVEPKPVPRPDEVSPPVAPPPPPRPSPVVGPAVQNETAVAPAASAQYIKYAGIAAAAVAVVALMAWIFSGTGTKPKQPENPPSRIELGTLVVDIAPWAIIESITNKADGKPAQSDCHETPCVLSLPAGEYRVSASNPNFPGKLEFDVKVEPGGVREEHRSVPGFRPEDEISKILDGKN